MKKYLILVALTFSTSIFGTPLSFEKVYRASQTASFEQQRLFWTELNQFILSYEQHIKRVQISATPSVFFLRQAYAQNLTWCVNNGFIAQVEKCDRANHWSFDVQNENLNPDYKLFKDAGLNLDCPEGKSPCSLVGGLTRNGGNYCSPNNTGTCLAASENGGLDRLIGAIKHCESGKETVTVGPKELNCQPLLQGLKNQMSALDRACNSAEKAVSGVCKKTQTRLQKIISDESSPVPMQAKKTENGEEKNSDAPLNTSSTDVLYIGDSLSVGCFGGTLHSKMTSSVSPATGKKLAVQTVATCGSSAGTWLRPHSTSCKGAGFRSCSINKKCSVSESGSTQSLKNLLSTSKPRVTVVALGANMLKGSWDADVIQTIINIKSSGSGCLWVGPAEARTKAISIEGYNRFVSNLKAVVEKQGCVFINSEPYTDRANIPTKDALGLHHKCEPANEWARAAFSKEIKPALDRFLSENSSTKEDKKAIR